MRSALSTHLGGRWLVSILGQEYVDALQHTSHTHSSIREYTEPVTRATPASSISSRHGFILDGRSQSITPSSKMASRMYQSCLCMQLSCWTYRTWRQMVNLGSGVDFVLATILEEIKLVAREIYIWHERMLEVHFLGHRWASIKRSIIHIECIFGSSSMIAYLRAQNGSRSASIAVTNLLVTCISLGNPGIHEANGRMANNPCCEVGKHDFAESHGTG